MELLLAVFVSRNPIRADEHHVYEDEKRCNAKRKQAHKHELVDVVEARKVTPQPEGRKDVQVKNL